MEGGGNDFIVLKPEDYALIDGHQQIKWLCDRHRGIGADGLISVNRSKEPHFDFQMIYHNADGSSNCFCGNGARCAVAYGRELFKLSNEVIFQAADGNHRGIIHDTEDIEISLCPAAAPEKILEGYYVDTGSHHFSLQVDDLDSTDVISEGRRWRHHDKFSPEGVNVNFWAISQNGIRIRTFEKGVEAETLGCGTGVVAVALTHNTLYSDSDKHLETSIQMDGGAFQVRACRSRKGDYSDIYLRGPVRKVFTGEVIL